MNIAVLGLGHIGSVTAGCLANQGHRVIGIDTNHSKVQAINEGRSPVVEPGLDEIIGAARADGRLRASTQMERDLARCELALVCVGTPNSSDGDHDLSQTAPPLTTVRQDIAAGAKGLVDLLLRRLGGEDTESLVLPPHLVVRETA